MSVEGSQTQTQGSTANETTSAPATAAKLEGWRVATEQNRPDFEIRDGMELNPNPADQQTAVKVQEALESNTPKADVIHQLAAGEYNSAESEVDEGVFREANPDKSNADVLKDTDTPPVIKINTTAKTADQKPDINQGNNDDGDVVDAEWTEVSDQGNPVTENTPPLSYHDGLYLTKLEVQRRINKENEARSKAGERQLYSHEIKALETAAEQQYYMEWLKRNPNNDKYDQLDASGNPRPKIYAIRGKSTEASQEVNPPKNEAADNRTEKPAAENQELLQKVAEIQAQMAVLQKQLAELQALIAQINSTAEANNSKDVSSPEIANNKLFESLVSSVILLGIEMFKILAGIMSEQTKRLTNQPAKSESNTSYPVSTTDLPGTSDTYIPELPEGTIPPQLPEAELPAVPQLTEGGTPMSPENNNPEAPQLPPAAELSASSPTN